MFVAPSLAPASLVINTHKYADVCLMHINERFGIYGQQPLRITVFIDDSQKFSGF
jgi:hypothetical protein